MEQIKKISDVYGVLLSLKEKYAKREDLQKEFGTLERYCKSEIQKLCDLAFEWLCEDEREKQEAHAEAE